MTETPSWIVNNDWTSRELSQLLSKINYKNCILVTCLSTSKCRYNKFLEATNSKNSIIVIIFSTWWAYSLGNNFQYFYCTWNCSYFLCQLSKGSGKQTKKTQVSVLLLVRLNVNIVVKSAKAINKRPLDSFLS